MTPIYRPGLLSTIARTSSSLSAFVSTSFRVLFGSTCAASTDLTSIAPTTTLASLAWTSKTKPSGKKTEPGAILYRSATLEKLWPFGFSSVGEVTFESAAYVARYILKKINGDLADEHYKFIDTETGEITHRRPEFTKMSLKPGIGAGWFEKWHGDVYPNDYVITRGAKSRPPKYYDSLLKKASPETLEAIKFERVLEGRAHLEDNTPERLAVREKVLAAKQNLFPRKLK